MGKSLGVGTNIHNHAAMGFGRPRVVGPQNERVAWERAERGYGTPSPRALKAMPEFELYSVGSKFSSKNVQKGRLGF